MDGTKSERLKLCMDPLDIVKFSLKIYEYMKHKCSEVEVKDIYSDNTDWALLG
jgi:hypothetical protein|tara:strand:- start:1265 stop:1423 length:159 start_codon:yes stop_codon:yes gene_type:complete